VIAEHSNFCNDEDVRKKFVLGGRFQEISALVNAISSSEFESTLATWRLP
jgi:hypothetical protein